MSHRKLSLALLLILPFVACGPTSAVPVGQDLLHNKDLRIDQLVFFAVLEGLYTDGVSTEAVDLMLAVDPKTRQPQMQEHFVYGCPLCLPAYDALVLYRVRPPFYARKDAADTFGGGLDDAAMRQLRSLKKEERRQAVQALIDRWVSARLDRLRLTREESAAWTRNIDLARDQGMAVLKRSPEYAGWKGCPICDGAAAACKLRN